MNRSIRLWLLLVPSVVSCTSSGSPAEVAKGALAAQSSIEAQNTGSGDQALLVRVPPNAECILRPDPSASATLNLNADERGYIRFYYGPANAIESAPKAHLTCISDNGSLTEDLNLASLLAEQPMLVASMPPRTGRLRQALGGYPLAPSQAELIAQGYPPRPDPVKAPRSYSAWLAHVSKPSLMIAPQAHRSTLSHSLDVDNNTWSGLILATGGGVQYENTAGRWDVPTDTVTTTSGTASLWVGLDGYVSPATTEVVQCGTDTKNVPSGGGHMAAYADWYQWYSPSDVSAHTFSSVDIAAGDNVYFSVWVGQSDGTPDVSGGFGWFYMSNNTQETSQLAHVTEASGVTFYGTSAEWIMERPSTGCPSACTPVNLASFGTATVTDPEATDSDYGYHDPSTDTSLQLRMKSTTSPYTVLATSSHDEYDVYYTFGAQD